MLLEEALAGGSNRNNNSTTTTSTLKPTLSPHDAALALLSFLRDELPAGGLSAEKRFVNLFPLIIDNVYGTWNAPVAVDDHSPTPTTRSPITSPGGSTYSSPSHTATAGSGGGEKKEYYRHLDGGWLSLFTSPIQPQRNTNNNNTNNQRQRTTNNPQQKSTTSLENDPIVRLLRAPNKKTPTVTSYTPPTLIDVISVESTNRPSIKFKLPLSALDMIIPACVTDWGEVYWNAIDDTQKNAANNNAAAARGNSGGGGFGGSPQQSSIAAANEKKEVAIGKIGKENATRILLHLLLSPGGSVSASNTSQLELKMYFQSTYQQRGQKLLGNGQQQQRSPTTYATPSKPHLIGGMSPNTMSTPQTHGNNNSNHRGEPNVELTMLEYYLFLFVRFPLANSNWDVQLSDYNRRRRMHGGMRVLLPYGQRVYAYLLSSYLNYYLSQGQVYEENKLSVGVDCFDGTTAVGNGNTQTAMERTSELFLRLIVEFWLEGANVALTTSESLSRYRRIRAGVSTAAVGGSNNIVQPTLSDSLELAQPISTTPFTSPPPQVQTYVLTVVRHLVSDRSMRELVQKASSVLQLRQKEDKQGGASAPTLVNEAGSSDNATGGSVSNTFTNTTVSWSLPPAMTAVQPPLFNYIRLGLACGAIHDRSSIFHRALETWLIWLEPWNYVLKRRVFVTNRQGSVNAGSGTPSGSSGGGGRRGAAENFLRNAAATVSSHHRVEYAPSYIQPKPTSPSTYTAQWEAYIASNAHYYTVPLAIFLKRARELDFSNSSEYPRSLALVQRVLRIYSKGVVNVLNSVLNSRADTLSTSLFTRHSSNIGAYCPPTTNWKLADCQLDATNLLEEVFSQYQKRKAAMDMFDRLEAKLNNLFSGKMGSEDAALDSLLTHVRGLVNLPLDYQVLPDEPRASSGFGLWRLVGLGAKPTGATGAKYENMLAPQRDPDGKLTDVGRQQLYAGLVKCNPLDNVHFIGDPMLARVKSYEIPVLVELTIRLSNYLNRKLDLVPPLPHTEGGRADENEDALLKKYHEMEQYQAIKYRINLRLFADSRNIIFFSIIWWMAKTIRSLFTN